MKKLHEPLGTRSAPLLEDKVAIITGGGSGIGLATAHSFARHGARIVVADISLDNAEACAKHIVALGGEALAVQADVSKDMDCELMVAQTLDRFGRLDIAFNNAGISGYPQLTADYGLENWQRVIDINLTGVFNCMVHELRAMQDHGGSIINTASIMGLKGATGGSAYCAAKHGVIGLTKATALEYGRYGIRVNALCPGFIETPMTVGDGNIFPDTKIQKGIQSAAIRRMAKPEEVAEMVAWLASDKASYVTGTSQVVDGGVTAA